MKLINQASPNFVSVICLPILLITWLVIPSVGSAETLASAQLQRDTSNQLLFFDQAFAPECRKRKILSTEVLEQPRNVRVVAGRRVSDVLEFSITKSQQGKKRIRQRLFVR